MLQIQTIIEKLGCLEVIGNHTTIINELLPLTLDNQRADVLFWCDEKNIASLSHLKKGTVICSKSVFDQAMDPEVNIIIVEQPRRYFAQVAKYFFDKTPIKQGISKTAVIHPSVILGENCYIGEQVVIEENCVLGNDCFIDHHTVIHHGTVLKNNVKIGAHNTIGGIGFGYEKNASGQYEAIPHCGNVIIEDNVEIGNNTCIDRAALGSTWIGKNVKIDNLVHISHGVQIDENALIIANAMIAGSVTIGKNAWIAPSASIINKTSIGDNAVIGLAAVVLKPVEDHAIVVGNPARELKK